MMTSEIILLEKSLIDQASQILAAAFLKDPLFSYALPQEDKVKDKLLHSIWKASLQYSLPHNYTYTTPEMKGIAIWIPPGAYPFNNLRFILAGFYKIPFQLGWKHLKKFISPFALFDEYHTQDMPVPH